MRISQPAKRWGHGLFAVAVTGILALYMPAWVDEQRGAEVPAAVVQVLTPRTATLRFVTAEGVECTTVQSWGNSWHFLSVRDDVMIRHGRTHPCENVRRTGDHSNTYLFLFACAGWALFWGITGFANESDYIQQSA